MGAPLPKSEPTWVEAIRLYENSPSGRGPLPSPSAAAAPKPASGQSLLWLLNLTSLAAAALLVGVMAIAWQSIAKLEALNERLGALTGFEKRIADKVERGNEGLHSQFDRTNSRINLIHGEIGELRASVGETVGSLEDAGARMASVLDARLEAALAAAARPDPPALSQAAPPLLARPVVRPVPKPAARRPAAPPAVADGGGVRFERVELPNGSVTYRRLR